MFTLILSFSLAPTQCEHTLVYYSTCRSRVVEKPFVDLRNPPFIVQHVWLMASPSDYISYDTSTIAYS